MIPKKEITEIFDAALSVFADFGFKKTTLGDIAEKLGMTSGNFYRYFKNKQDLYEQCVSHVLRQWQDYSFSDVDNHTDTRSQFISMSEKAVEYLSVNDVFRRLLIRDPDIFSIFPENDPYEKINNESVTRVQKMLEKGIVSREFRQFDPEHATQLLWLVYKTFIVQIYVKNREKEMQETWRLFLDLITNGLFAEPCK